MCEDFCVNPVLFCFFCSEINSQDCDLGLCGKGLYSFKEIGPVLSRVYISIPTSKECVILFLTSSAAFGIATISFSLLDRWL